MNQVLYFITLFLITALDVKNPSVNHTMIHIGKESSLRISGTTNVNTFNCNFATEKMMRPIAVQYQKTDSKYIFRQADLVLDNLGFDCGSGGINKDFHELLQSKQHPHILLKLKEIKLDPNTSTDLLALVDIKIAGRTNTYKVPIQCSVDTDMEVQGELKLSLNDFKLKAPKKVLGLIMVRDTVTINFDLVLRQG